ncbi:MAG: phosphoenolpyruvate--protein phosphotransferase [Waddliaceae bacterium]|jgi:phosphoenolpyruvate-protein phosphotransferase (PTS system enzyme I)|nr:phosphoenolpyruvate--protein phosphotransferase [Waddliaceae bacterium]MBT3578717.1 phosphoenolpyruvate--protein phosphotransferase [Waddliaceae bacterium]MBT4444381.1 phosphoenolpyruvate--protein phosphotransferase [Waddliaceae bacterium]MBT6928296.1 phosphoenolpyruvate--protein phosphotransferase [Waddliaceae bacterium]MBT7264982.1 phosphoenolpyruvate--protein phosphotransferase [Waddliaceae bacterium]
MVDKKIFLKGSPLCSGVAIGKPFIFTFADEIIPNFSIAANEVEDEIKRYRKALRLSKKDITKLQKKLKKEGASEGADMLATHLHILQDPLITTAVEDKIRETRKNTEYIFRLVVDEYEERFNKISDEFFRERFRDIQDISRRILAHLRKSVTMSLAEIPENSVVFAHSLLPSDVAEAKISSVAAFVTEGCGETSHAVIVAKAKGIPYVSTRDFDVIEEKIQSGKNVIVDGRTGDIIIDPTPETLEIYRAIKERLHEEYVVLEKSGSLEAETIDGYSITLSANVDNIEDIGNIRRYPNTNIGLFRSEYILLKQEAFPTEDEQYVIYKKLVTTMAGLPVTIRTFDIGGDKWGDFQEFNREDNPFLGCRSIRFMLRDPELFKTQLRAILRASAFGAVNIIFPMVSGYYELMQAKKLLEEAKQELLDKGESFGEKIQVGCMIEVPSAALICDILAKECDFFSIGTNDLVQYSLAVDRGNQDVDYLYRPAHPSIIRLIKIIVTEAKKNGMPVSICGEIAADPRFTALLIGLGVENLSVAMRHIPIIKNVIRSLNIVDAYALTEKIMTMSSSEEIRNALDEYYHARVRSLDSELIYQ